MAKGKLFGFLGKDDDDLPDELKDLSKEDLVKAVQASKKVEALEQELTNRPTNEVLEGIQAELEANKQRLSQIESGRGEDDDNNNKNHSKQMTSFLADGDRAFAERAQPLAGMVLQVAATNAKNECRRQLEELQRREAGNIDSFLFSKFEKEIDDMTKRVPAAQLSFAETWMNLFFNAKGRHSNEIVRHNTEKKGDFYLESNSGGSRTDGSGTEGNKDTPKELSPKQKKIARGLGLTDEEFAAGQKDVVQIADSVEA